MPKIGKDVSGKRRHRRKTAKDFGDNPKIRRSHGEYKRYAKQQPWERRYRQQKKKKK